MQVWGLYRAAFGPVMSAGMVGLAILANGQARRRVNRQRERWVSATQRYLCQRHRARHGLFVGDHCGE